MNMSYCRFHNTLNDLQDCGEALDELEGIGAEAIIEKIGKEEYMKMTRLVELCRVIGEFEEE